MDHVCTENFLVPVEKATPACSSKCPNLTIYSDNEYEIWHSGTKTRIRKHTCVNASYCQILYDGMKQELNTNNFNDLPKEIKTYIEFIEKETGVPVKIVSVGPDRNKTIFR